jgi:hypothetical protein
MNHLIGVWSRIAATGVAALLAMLAMPGVAAAARPVNQGIISATAYGGHIDDPTSALVPGDYLSLVVRTDSLAGQADPDHFVARLRTTVYWDGDTTATPLPNRCLYRQRRLPVEVGLDDAVLVPVGATSVRVTFALDNWSRRAGWYEVDVMDTGTLALPAPRPWPAFSETTPSLVVFDRADD